MGLMLTNGVNMLRALLILALLAIHGCSHAGSLCAQYKNGSPVIIVSTTENDESELYADWEFYLNNFISKHQEYEIKSDINELPPMTVIFAKQGKNSFELLESPEPILYEMINTYYQNHSDKDKLLETYVVEDSSKIEKLLSCKFI
jgi:hypothetical protein